jgi:methanogenic corrinoid protein MtbC1
LLTDVRQAWVAACKQFNEREADAILAQAFALFTTETVCMEVLMGGLAELGSGWYDGDVIVQQEHFATQLAKRRLEALIQATPPPTRADRILVAAPAGEDHDLVLLLLVLLLRRRSLDVIDLGANVPARHLVSVVANTKSDMVITAAQRLHTAASLQQMAQALLAQQIPLLYGGRIFNLIPELRKRIAGHFIGERLEEVTQVVEAHLAKPRPASPAELASEAYQRARIQFQAQLPLIEGDVLTTLGEGIVEEHLMTANLHMAQDIDAALSLGDMGLMGSEIEWLEGLLDNHQMPREQLERYLAAYRQAAHRNLDETGRPVTEWLEQISQPTR